MPSIVLAQASIAGVVSDASGAVLPGVTVEASSPALIEKVRSAVTDGSGQYRIVDLRPGTYAVTFSLTGFSIVQARRHRADRVVHRDDQRRHAGRRLEETITVTGETPDRRRAERPAADDAEQRNADDGADRTILGCDGAC